MIRTRRILLTLLALLLLAAAATFIYSRRALPQVDGELHLPGLRADVRIERDAHGIPSIRAANLNDALFGLGVVHAQDRLWQMETHRRIGAGRLAEAFGEGALDTDRVLRALGIRRAAQAQWQQMQGAAREALLAYTQGVNAAIVHALRARPPEFVILGLHPEPWEPVDSLAWSIMMAWDLGGNWTHELMRLRLSMTLQKQRIDEAMPPYPGEQPLPTQDYSALYRQLKLDSRRAGVQAGIDRLLAAAPPSGRKGVGSNSWVLAGARSATGAPLLANDPHLDLTAPSLWYFARLEVPGLKLAGATMPGVPGVVLGQNEHIAWGFTNTGPDVQDLYLERIKPGDPSQYQTPEGWAKFEAQQESIRVRGKADVTVTLRRTRHGPVISDAGLADGLAGLSPQGGYALAMRWTALDADSRMLDSSLGMSQSRSVAEFIDAARGWGAPMQNMLVADRAGHIALVSPGRVPIRKIDNDLMGVAPAPGWEARYDWAGWLPFEVLPQLRDPALGYIANANQKVVPTGTPHYLASNWDLPYRHQRIVQLLDSRQTHSLDDLRAIQADVRSLAAPPLLKWLKQANSPHPLAALARQQLDAFDGEMRADQAAPLIYWSWFRHLSRRVLADELGASFMQTLAVHDTFDTLARVLARNDPWWCDDKTTAQLSENCAQQVDAALGDALDELQVLQGRDVAAWRWGRSHLALSEHRPFSKVRLLARWFELRTPVGGDSYSINVAGVGLAPDSPSGEFYLSEQGASLRALYDLGDISQSRVMHSTGQSGIVWSPLYRNFVAPWTAVEYVPLWPRPGMRGDVLVLRPAG